jgi:hypothetical protein
MTDVVCVQFDEGVVEVTPEVELTPFVRPVPGFLKWLSERYGIVVLVSARTMLPGGVDKMAAWLVDQAAEFRGRLHCEVQFDAFPRADVPWYSAEVIRNRGGW